MFSVIKPGPPTFFSFQESFYGKILAQIQYRTTIVDLLYPNYNVGDWLIAENIYYTIEAVEKGFSDCRDVTIRLSIK